MKRKMLCAGLVSLASVAHAQSNVTLSGRLDNGFLFQSGLPHGSQFSAQSGGFGESYFGLTGAEDIGGGTKVIFALQSGINTYNGSSIGGLFGREAIVGATNDAFGTLKLGNTGGWEIDEDSWYLDPQEMQLFSISTLVRGRNWTYAGSGIEYTTPSFGGLTAKGQYHFTNSTKWNGDGGFGSGPGQLLGAQGRSDGIEARYDSTNFQILAIYDEIRDPYGKFSNVYVASRSILAGINFTVGPVKFFVGAQHLSAPDASNYGYFGTAEPGKLPAGTSLPTAVNHEWLGARWQASSFTSLILAVYHANANNGNGNATMYTLSGQYNLSKSTFLYTALAYIHNSATSNVGLGNGYTNPYGPNANNDPVNGGLNTAPNYGHGQFGATAGIMKQF